MSWLIFDITEITRFSKELLFFDFIPFKYILTKYWFTDFDGIGRTAS